MNAENLENTGVPVAELIVRNARITTLDPALPAASALAVTDGRIIAIGTERDVERHRGPSTRVLDGLNRRLVPGLNDSHTHVIRGGLQYLLELRWDGVESLADALSLLSAQAARTPPGHWVRVVGGWSATQFAERRLPTVAELNRAAPDTPVFVLHLYQAAILNRVALQAIGYDRDTPDPPGGQIVRDGDGMPTGMLIAAPNALILYSTLARAPRLDPATQELSTRYFLRELNRFGLTSVIDAAGGFQDYPDDYRTIERLAAAGELSLRVAYNLFPQQPGAEIADLTRWADLVAPGDGDEWLRFNGAGENVVWSAADFENFRQPRPDLPTRMDTELDAAVRLLVERRWPFRLHATYNETIERDLAVFERVDADYGGILGATRGGVRWWFDHAETVSRHSLDRIAALGGGVAVQDRMAFQGEYFLERYGRAAALSAPPMRHILERGIPLGLGTDATRVSSYHPWRAIHWAVTGRTVGGVGLYTEDNLLTRTEALRAMTVGSAWFSGEQFDKGVLSVGRLADFAVLDRDYFTIPEQMIPAIEADLTVVGGRIVHAAGEFTGLAPELPAIRPDWSPVTAFGGHRPHKLHLRPLPADPCWW